MICKNICDDVMFMFVIMKCINSTTVLSYNCDVAQLTSPFMWFDFP